MRIEEEEEEEEEAPEKLQKMPGFVLIDLSFLPSRKRSIGLDGIYLLYANARITQLVTLMSLFFKVRVSVLLSKL
jgi:hypothetical protein